MSGAELLWGGTKGFGSCFPVWGVVFEEGPRPEVVFYVWWGINGSGGGMERGSSGCDVRPEVGSVRPGTLTGRDSVMRAPPEVAPLWAGAQPEVGFVGGEGLETKVDPNGWAEPEVRPPKGGSRRQVRVNETGSGTQCDWVQTGSGSHALGNETESELRWVTTPEVNPKEGSPTGSGRSGMGGGGLGGEGQTGSVLQAGMGETPNRKCALSRPLQPEAPRRARREETGSRLHVGEGVLPPIPEVNPTRVDIIWGGGVAVCNRK